MKLYVVLMLQWIVWSCFTLAEWLSQHDRLLFKAIMFLLFFQLSLVIGKKILKSSFSAACMTIVSLVTYMAVHLVLQQWTGPIGT
ncbi:hypothetical protein IEO70_00615 [Bacillus sp. AGMB 02131]|uniref:Uncharacterized protein n=1 Tax=Peribacillus faecalis TaxID=2772559 RepID=A0A927CTF3_9BACI|nr:hypothetical protein [Peribacillus faecalis]MBD3106879.1 hypothetical protein [Peribacillus faecalis]